MCHYLACSIQVLLLLSEHIDDFLDNIWLDRLQTRYGIWKHTQISSYTFKHCSCLYSFLLPFFRQSWWRTAKISILLMNVMPHHLLEGWIRKHSKDLTLEYFLFYITNFHQVISISRFFDQYLR